MSESVTTMKPVKPASVSVGSIFYDVLSARKLSECPYLRRVPLDYPRYWNKCCVDDSHCPMRGGRWFHFVLRSQGLKVVRVCSKLADE